MNNALFDLLTSLYHYYPIGTQIMDANYPGIQERLAIVENKIIGLNEGKTTLWNQIIAEIRDTFANTTVYDRSYYQFPSYVVELSLFSKQLPEIRHDRNIIANLSLLTTYYTVFIEDKYFFTHLSHEPFKNPYHAISLSYKRNGDSALFDDIAKLRAMIQSNFQNHKFIPHIQLFNHKVTGGTPHGEDKHSNNESYCIFDFLFLNRPYHAPIIVID